MIMGFGRLCLLEARAPFQGGQASPVFGEAGGTSASLEGIFATPMDRISVSKTLPAGSLVAKPNTRRPRQGDWRRVFGKGLVCPTSP
jgi:hypothetical protein